jgi:hypothetical protein
MVEDGIGERIEWEIGVHARFPLVVVVTYLLLFRSNITSTSPPMDLNSQQAARNLLLLYLHRLAYRASRLDFTVVLVSLTCL